MASSVTAMSPVLQMPVVATWIGGTSAGGISGIGWQDGQAGGQRLGVAEPADDRVRDQGAWLIRRHGGRGVTVANGGEEFGTARARGGIARRARAEGDHLGHQARLGQRFLGQSGQRRHQSIGAQHVRVARCARIQGLADLPGGVGGPVRLTRDLAVNLRQAVPVELECGPVERLDRGLRDLVEPAGQPAWIAGVDLAEQVAQGAGVQQPDGSSPPKRGVGAGPCVADGDQAGNYRLAVHHQPAVAVLDGGDHLHVSDRLAGTPVRDGGE